MKWQYGLDQEEVDITINFGGIDVFYGFDMEDLSKRHNYGGDYLQSVFTLSTKQSIKLCAMMIFDGYAKIQPPEDETDSLQVIRCQSVIEELKTLFIVNDEYRSIPDSCWYARYGCTIDDLHEHDNPASVIYCIDLVVTDLKMTTRDCDREVEYYNELRDLISQRRVVGDQS